MRLPKDPENWTGEHAEKAIDYAWKLFEKYEAKIDFDWPQKKQDELYRPYLIAREEAVQVATYTRWCEKEAKMLP